MGQAGPALDGALGRVWPEPQAKDPHSLGPTVAPPGPLKDMLNSWRASRFTPTFLLVS